MLRKLISWPVLIIFKMVATIGLFGMLLAKLIEGKSIENIDKGLSALLIGVKAAGNDDDAIVELVEKHYGSGKAMMVSEILSKD